MISCYLRYAVEFVNFRITAAGTGTGASWPELSCLTHFVHTVTSGLWNCSFHCLGTVLSTLHQQRSSYVATLLAWWCNNPCFNSLSDSLWCSECNITIDMVWWVEALWDWTLFSSTDLSTLYSCDESSPYYCII